MLEKTFPTSPFDGFLSPPSAGAVPPNIHHPHGERLQMDETELKTILRCLELALAVYATREGKLTAQEISLKSMLNVIRGQVLNSFPSTPPRSEPSEYSAAD